MEQRSSVSASVKTITRGLSVFSAHKSMKETIHKTKITNFFSISFSFLLSKVGINPIKTGGQYGGKGGFLRQMRLL
jgi:hypothetical protein